MRRRPRSELCRQVRPLDSVPEVEEVSTTNAIGQTQDVAKAISSSMGLQYSVAYSRVEEIVEDVVKVALDQAEDLSLLNESDDPRFCRICLEVGPRRYFISPCNCKGSISLVHRECLERWLALSVKNQCELCGFNFRLLRLPKYTFLGSVVAFLFSRDTPGQWRMLLLDVLIVPILVFLIIACTNLGMSVVNHSLADVYSEDSFPYVISRLLQTFIGSTVAMFNVLVLSWIVLRMCYHSFSWYAFYKRNSRVILLESRKWKPIVCQWLNYSHH